MNNELPIYLQIVKDMCKLICIGEYKPGEKIPSVRDLALRYNANPNTCVKSLQILEDKGLIVTASTSGKFITKSEEVIQDLKNEIFNNFVLSIVKEAKEMKIDLNVLVKKLIEGDEQ